MAEGNTISPEEMGISMEEMASSQPETPIETATDSLNQPEPQPTPPSQPDIDLDEPEIVERDGIRYIRDRRTGQEFPTMEGGAIVLPPHLNAHDLRNNIRRQIRLIERSGTSNSAAFLNELQGALGSYDGVPEADLADIFHEAEVKMRINDIYGAVGTVDYKGYGERIIDPGDLTYLWTVGRYEHAVHLRRVVQEMEQNNGAYFREMIGPLTQSEVARINIDNHFTALFGLPVGQALTPEQTAIKRDVINLAVKLFAITQRGAEFLGPIDTDTWQLMDLQVVRTQINNMPGMGPRTDANQDAWDIAYYTELKQRRIAAEQAGVPVAWEGAANHGGDHPDLGAVAAMRGAVYSAEQYRLLPSTVATQLCHAAESYVRSAVSDTNSSNLVEFMNRSTGNIPDGAVGMAADPILPREIRSWQGSVSATGSTVREKMSEFLKMPFSTNLKEATKPLMEAISALGHIGGAKTSRLARFAAAELAADALAYTNRRGPDSEATQRLRAMPTFNDDQVNRLFSSLRDNNVIDQADKDRSLGRLHAGDGRVYYRRIGIPIFMTIWETLKAFLKQVIAK